jgi:hypothetical protein
MKSDISEIKELQAKCKDLEAANRCLRGMNAKLLRIIEKVRRAVGA